MKIGFTSENKTSRGPDYPKLHLDHGQTARICLVDAEPDMLYVHTFNMPVVDNGEIVTQVRKSPKGDRQEMVTEFVGQFICHGDIEVVQKEEVDPARCEGCKQVVENPEWHQPPRRRFAQHVIQYETKPGGFTAQTPFQAKLLLWVYPETKFNALVDFADEHGDLRKIDLLLGPCENKLFQKYDIKVGAKCEWLADDSRKKLVKDLYANNQCKDVEAMIARTSSALQIKTDAAKVKQRWGLVGGTAPTEEDVLGDDVLDAVSGAVDSAEMDPKAEEAPAAELDVETPETAVSEPEAEATEEAPEAAEEKPKKKPADDGDEAEEFDFDSLLNSV